MNVATRLSAAFCLLVAVLAGLLIYHVRTNRSAVSASYELAEISSRLSLTSTRQIAALNQLEEAAGKYWVTRDAGYLQLFQQAFRDFETGLLGLAADAQTELERAEIAELQERWNDFRPAAQTVGTDVLLSDPPVVAFGQTLATLRQQTRRVTDAAQAAMSERLEASASASRQAEQVSWIVGAGTLLLTVIVFTLLVRSITSGLTRLQQGTHQVALGDFDYRIPAEGGDEFAQLARDFNVMTRKLGETDRIKRDFISKVSHDLKTPLASMRETVQLMLDEVPGPVTARQRRLLELTNQSAERLSSMIIKILDLSAMEAGALTLEVGEHRTDELIARAVDALALGDPLRGSRIVTVLPDVPLVVQCDRDQTLQVLVNLLENALKFSEEGTPVHLSARSVTSRDSGVPADYRRLLIDSPAGAVGALFEVTDRGPGVPDEDKSRIFEHFYQSSSGSKVPGRGVGLGLAICREIADLHGGAIWVRDSTEGGSTFSVLLPRARLEPAVRESSRRASEGVGVASA
jgi:signal transduction histidine kinase